MRVEIVRTFDFDVPGMLSRSKDNANPDAIEIVSDFVKRSSVVWVGKADGVEACAVGLIPPVMLASEAYLWLLHTEICESHPLRFVRWSKRVLSEAQALYPVIFGHCLATQHWLKWLGAEFDGISFRFVRNG